MTEISGAAEDNSNEFDDLNISTVHSANMYGILKNYSYPNVIDKIIAI